MQISELRDATVAPYRAHDVELRDRLFLTTPSEVTRRITRLLPVHRRRITWDAGCDGDIIGYGRTHHAPYSVAASAIISVHRLYPYKRRASLGRPYTMRALIVASDAAAAAATADLC